MHSFLTHSLPLIAQANDDGAAAAAGFFAAFFFVFCGIFVVLYGIIAVICWYLSGILKAIPPEHRKQEPKMVWLLMIPLVNIVWNFFVYPKIADSFKSYFDSIGRTEVGDCGRGLALTYCILVCCLVIPYLNACVGIAVLVIWIILLVKFSTLKGQIQAGSLPSAPTIPPV